MSRGKAPDQEVDDIGDQALSYAEVKALATGEPLILERATVDASAARLARLQRAHQGDQHRLRRTLESAERRIPSLGEGVSRLESAIGRRVDTRADRFRMSAGDARPGRGR